jgi:hypothetical protein
LSWVAMKQRCNDSSSSAYGGRGVQYDPLWESFDSFLDDMGERPEGRTLDRIDPDSNYGPGLCEWSTPEEQANNQRRTEILRFNVRDGIEGSVADWARWLRRMTGNEDWDSHRLKACLKVLTITQIMLATHPSGIDARELRDREEVHTILQGGASYLRLVTPAIPEDSPAPSEISQSDLDIIRSDFQSEWLSAEYAVEQHM